MDLHNVYISSSICFEDQLCTEDNVRSVETRISVQGGAVKSLAQPTSRCHRTESIVSLKRGVCSCAEVQVFSCYRG